jgi:hypothetical protein
MPSPFGNAGCDLVVNDTVGHAAPPGRTFTAFFAHNDVVFSALTPGSSTIYPANMPLPAGSWWTGNVQSFVLASGMVSCYLS